MAVTSVNSYRCIDPDRIIATAMTLRDRIVERFPDRGIARVAGEVLDIAVASANRVAWVGKPNRFLRVLGVIITSLLVLFSLGVVAALTSKIRLQVTDLGGLLQMIEAGINDVILVSAALYFIWTIELRWKRSRALADLNELRAIAHIIDMHQLTKDPERLVQRKLLIGIDTPSSPIRELDEFQLSRYLDYCSEMLALLSKIAAQYPQQIDDAVVLSAVDEIENLTAGLSRKIWQKIMILNLQPRI